MTALREGRIADADVLRRAREAAVAPPPPVSEDPVAVVADVPPDVLDSHPEPAGKEAGTSAKNGKSADGEPAERR